MPRLSKCSLLLIACLCLLQATAIHAAGHLDQATLGGAVDVVASSVVQIRTVGGLDRLGKQLLSQGPTTGLIVSPDGYVVSSAYNFASQPTSILVLLPSGQQRPADLIARDKNRMLVLLKVESPTQLRVPQAAPPEEFRVGQWAVAVGRTFSKENVGVSVGIVSALHRMYGRVVQTDASVSVANYGGPLVDVHGRVLGVLVPMSPQTSGEDTSELAGAEFYDSGIGFAVPLQHIFEKLDDWKEGSDLLPGKLGIGLPDGSEYTAVPEVVSVWPSSPAAKAGWQVGDLIVAIDNHPIESVVQLRFQVAPRYAGDTLKVAIRRGQEELDTNVTLAGKFAPFEHAFLGVLPMRRKPNKEEVGVTLRGAWPESPAAKAGLESGDRITKISDEAVADATAAAQVIGSFHPGQSVELSIVRKEKQFSLEANLGTLPEDILSGGELVLELSEENEETELTLLKLPEFPQEAVYLSVREDGRGAPGFLMWLGSGEAKQHLLLVDDWHAFCHSTNTILLIASPADKGGWTSEDLPYLDQLGRAARTRLGIDRRRAIVLGQGKAGQLALALALKRRSHFAGVVAVEAPLPRTLKVPANLPGAQLAVLSVESQNSAFAPLIRRDLAKLRDARYPVSWHQRAPTNDPNSRLDAATLGAIQRWLDGLDRF